MTFKLNDLCFIDTETRALPGCDTTGDLKDDGTYRYMTGAKVIIVTWAIGDGPVQIAAMDGGFGSDRYKLSINVELPQELRDFWMRANAGNAWFVAWNAGFDKTAWNQGLHNDGCIIKADMILDAMAQAVASNLPPSLEGASQFIGRQGKQGDGKALIKLFTPADGATPQSHPQEWERFKSYAMQDIDELRAVWLSTLPLDYGEWEEYWAAERVNERGQGFDVEFAKRAARVASFNADVVNRKIKALTGGVVTKVTQHKRIADFVWDHLEGHAEARDIMVKAVKEDPDSDDDEEIVALSVNRNNVTKLIAYLKAQESLDNVLKGVILPLLELREFGASAAPQKFQKMLDQGVNGRLYGQYVFNGAGQTGRFSAKGVQVHNMTRDVLGKKGRDEAAAIEMINDLEDF